MATPTQTVPGVSQAVPAPVPAVRPRLYVLDGLRLLAASTVLFGHWVGAGIVLVDGKKGVQVWGRPTGEVFGPVVHAFAEYGWMGVDLFFLISGFVICMSSWGRDLWSFVRSRIVRLFPAFWFCVLLTTGVLALHRADTRLLSTAITNLTMAHKAYGIYDIDPVYWTLWIELRFYLLFAVVVTIGLSHRRVVAFCWLWMIGAVLAAASGDHLFYTILQPRYAPFFVAGIAFYLIRRFGSTLMLWGLVAFCFAIAQRTVQGDARAEMDAMGSFPLWPTILILALIFVVMGLVAVGRFDFVQWRGLVTAGALTYPLYLLHQQIGFIAIQHLHTRIPAVPLVLALFAAMLAAAYLIHRLVERPGSRWLGKELNRSFEAMRRD